MVKCELCGKELKTTQGLAGHLRLAHAQRDAPALVKPALPIEALEALMDKAELQDHTEASPCCAARLRSARQVLGIADGALDKCFICARCGEWYIHRPEGYLLVRYRDGAPLDMGVSYLEHLPQESVPEPNPGNTKRPGLGSIFKQS